MCKVQTHIAFSGGGGSVTHLFIFLKKSQVYLASFAKILTLAIDGSNQLSLLVSTCHWEGPLLRCLSAAGPGASVEDRPEEAGDGVQASDCGHHWRKDLPPVSIDGCPLLDWRLLLAVVFAGCRSMLPRFWAGKFLERIAFKSLSFLSSSFWLEGYVCFLNFLFVFVSFLSHENKLRWLIVSF